MRLQSNILHSRTGMLLAASAGLQVLLSFGLQWYIVLNSDGRAEADAFYAASTLPQMVSVLLIDTLPLVLVPWFSGVPEDRLSGEAWEVLAVAAGILAVLSVVIGVTARPLMNLLVPGFAESTRELTTDLTQIQALGLAGAGWTAILTSICQVRNLFLLPPLALLLSIAGAWILVAWKMATVGIVVGAWAQVVIALVPALIMLPVVGLPTTDGWSVTRLMEMWRKLRPVVLGKAYFIASSPVDRLLISYLPPGSLVIFELVSRLYSSALRVLSQGILTPFLPQFSRLAAKNDLLGFRGLLRSQSRQMLAYSVAIVVAAEAGVLLVLPNLTFLLGPLDESSLNMIGMVVACLGGALPCMALVNVLSCAFYTQGDTSSPAKIGAVAYTLGLGIRFAGFWLAGFTGIALAATVWTALHAYLLHRALATFFQSAVLQSAAGAVDMPEYEAVAE